MSKRHVRDRVDELSLDIAEFMRRRTKALRELRFEAAVDLDAAIERMRRAIDNLKHDHKEWQ